MRLAIYTNIVSPHQLPLARELIRIVGPQNFRYVYAEEFHVGRKNLGWQDEDEPWMLSRYQSPAEADTWLQSCDVLICGIRDWRLLELRCRSDRRSFYASERWFKPIPFLNGRLRISGRIRMLIPRYRKMAGEFVRLVKTYRNLTVLPMGVHAARDMAWLFGGEATAFDRRPGGAVRGKGEILERIRMWGYFVAPTVGLRSDAEPENPTSCRLLWAGRMLRLKHVEDVVRAVIQANRKNTGIRYTLDVFGHGEDEKRIHRLARGSSCIRFHDPVRIEEVRLLMRQHDIYVFSSNALEGWGAVVSEALEEGIPVVGTFEAGASATMLPRSQLYHAGKVRDLEQILHGLRYESGHWLLNGREMIHSIQKWNASNAAKAILEMST